MTKIRVLVVEDSLTVRRRICDVLSRDPGIEVIGEAADGQEGLAMCEALRPDVMTLDMLLPRMTGLEVTEQVMAHFPTPILIVSSSTNRGDLFKTYEALAAGAVDVLEKPMGDEIDDVWERRLISAVRIVARVKVITHPRARLGSLGKVTAATPALPPPPPSPARLGRVVAIGASTGGPGAIVQVLSRIPRQTRVPILVVLHIDAPFGVAFAEWLGTQVTHPVSTARGGEVLASLGGRVIMAPSGQHLAVRGGVLELTTDPPRHSCRPSVDVLFESLALDSGDVTLACLLTGMGRDGAAGLLEIRRRGGQTVTQDEATSVVYGMPREAALLGAAEWVLPISQIGPFIASRLWDTGTVR